MLPSPSKGLNSLPIDGRNSPIFPTDYMIKQPTIFTLKAIISCYEAMVSLTVHCCLLLIILIEMANSFVNVQKKSIFSLKSLKSPQYDSCILNHVKTPLIKIWRH